MSELTRSKNLTLMVNGTCQKAQHLACIALNITTTPYLLNSGYALLAKALKRIESAFILVEMLRQSQANFR